MFLNDADVRAIKGATSLNSLLQLTYRNYATFVGSSSVLFPDAVYYLCSDRFVHSPSLNKRFCIRGDRLHWHLFYLKPLSESAFLENPLNEQISCKYL